MRTQNYNQDLTHESPGCGVQHARMNGVGIVEILAGRVVNSTPRAMYQFCYRTAQFIARLFRQSLLESLSNLL